MIGLPVLNRGNKLYKQTLGLFTGGAYVLMGYFAGGKLAFDVAKELEQRGKTVSHMIIIDTVPTLEPINVPFSIEDNRQLVDMFFDTAGIKDALAGNFLEAQILKKIENYYNYMARTVHTGKISSDIHLLRSVDQTLNTDAWKDFTHRRFKSHRDSGQHVQMLTGEHLAQNVDIIRDIMNQIEYK